MPREITFFVNDDIEALSVAAIADEAAGRGWSVRHSRDLSAQADVGFYVSHSYDIPAVRSSFSAIMLHDLGQQQTSWPHFWHVEPWSRFDVGLLPGPRWQAMFGEASSMPGFSGGPRLGVYEVGWPKADRLWARSAVYQQEVDQLSAQLGLGDLPNILYAPSYENDGKQEDVVQACRDLPANLLIKQAVWPDAFPDIQRSIREMADRHRGLKGVHILDQQLDIMVALGMADVLITDESCVMFEALLHQVPTLSVQDWLVPCEQPPRRVKAAHEFLVRTTKATLRRDLEKGLAGGLTSSSFGLTQSLETYQDQWFSKRGRAAVAIMDLMEWMAGTRPDSASGPAPVLKRCQAEAAHLASWKQHVEQSWSWRLTRPLRALLGGARR